MYYYNVLVGSQNLCLQVHNISRSVVQKLAIVTDNKQLNEQYQYLRYIF